MSLYKLPHIAARIFNTPLLVTYNRMAEIIATLNDRIEINADSISSYPSAGEDDSFPEQAGNVAVIHVNGTLVHQGGFADALSGIQSYSSIRSSYAMALSDSRYDSILWVFRSPGGEVPGLFELIDEIYASRGIKPMAAYINEMSTSAAYGIASAVGNIFIPRTGMVGSVGVIALHRSQVKADEKAGLEYTAIYAGAKKNDGNPHEPLSASARKDLQERVDGTYELFTATVARNLGLSQQAIKDTEAGDYIGEKAVQVGFASQIASYSEVIDHLQYQQGGKIMPGIIPNAQSQADAQRIEQLELQLGQLKAQGDEDKEIINALKATTAQAPSQIEEKIAEERARITQITNICGVHNVPELAEGFIKEGKSIVDVNAVILDALAERSKAQDIINPKPNDASTVNPLIEVCKQRAAKTKATWQNRGI